jgi:hypothetical protein
VPSAAQSFHDQVEGAELQNDEAVKQDDVHDAAFPVPEQIPLTEHFRDKRPQPLPVTLPKIVRPAQFQIGIAAVDGESEQVHRVSGDGQKQEQIHDPPRHPSSSFPLDMTRSPGLPQETSDRLAIML